MQAAAKGNMELLRLIMDNAKDFRVYVNQRDNDGWNCLFYTLQGMNLFDDTLCFDLHFLLIIFRFANLN